MLTRVVGLLLALVATKVIGAFRLARYNSTVWHGRTHRAYAAPDKSLLEINAENVEKVLDLVRPQLASDGGGVSLVGIEDHEVKVKVCLHNRGHHNMQFDGACKACPHRIGTVKGVIEATLARFLEAKDGKQITVKLVDE